MVHSSGGGLYAAGDHFAVQPVNPPDVVELAARALCVDVDATVVLTRRNNQKRRKTHTSPAPVQGPNYRYEVTLRRVDGSPSTGFAYHCCWPCACDAEDLIKVS